MLSATTNQHVRRPPRALGATLAPFAIGVVVGFAALVLGDMQLKWAVWVILLLAGVTAALRVRDKEHMLWCLFILAFQGDVYFRLISPRGRDNGLAIALSVLVGLTLLTWYRLTGDPRGPRRFVFAGRLAAPIIAMLATSFIAMIPSSERFVGVGRLLFELQLYFVYFLALNVIRSEERMALTLRLLFVVLATQALVYFVESALGKTFTLTGEVIDQGSLPRPGGTVSTNPAGFASFMMPLLMIAAAQFLSRPDPRHSRYAGILAGLGIAAIGLSFTRAAYVGLVIGFTWLVVVSYRRRVLNPSRMFAIGAAAVTIALIISPLVAVRLSESVSDAYDERAGLMRIALRVVEAHPLTGVGPGAYEERYKGYLASGDTDQWLAMVHNEYLLRAAETGIPGGLAFIALLLLGVRQALRVGRTAHGFLRTTAIGWSAALVALIWEMYWDAWRGFTYNALLWFMLGLTEAAERLEDARAAQGTGSSDSSTGGAGGNGPPDWNSSAPMSQRAPWGRA